MALFYKIADLIVLMNSFGRTVDQASAYLHEEEKADIVIQSNWENLRRQQPHLSDEECEYLSSGASFYKQLLCYDGMMLHASAVVVDGKAYLFSAPCGTGKSTHTRLWLSVFGDRAYILNDDKPALRLIDGVWYAFGTPWSGKDDCSVNIGVPVAGICLLHQAKENVITPFLGKDAIFAILEQTIRPIEAKLQDKLLELLDKLMTTIPIWKMGCNMEEKAAMVSYDAMSAGNQGDIA